MRGDDAKQYDNIVAYVPEYGGNLAVEAHNISVVSQFEIPLMTPRRHRRLGLADVGNADFATIRVKVITCKVQS